MKSVRKDITKEERYWKKGKDMVRKGKREGRGKNRWETKEQKERKALRL